MTKRDFSRQSFLGPESDAILASAKVCIVGLGGGGSHVGQQLAHLGSRNVVAVDEQRVDNSNLNRLVGATWQDVLDESPKVIVASRVIKGINPDARVLPLQEKWQNCQEALRDCDVIFGCVDSYLEREQLERFARRFCIPYIDIGMDVFPIGNHFSISGQVILSSPGSLCMRCMGFLTESKLKQEALGYGAAGHNPQVVWANGVLASTAIGVFVQLMTPWHPQHQETVYLEYDGNAGTVVPSNRLVLVKLAPCTHFNAEEVGDPFYGRSRGEVK